MKFKLKSIALLAFMALAFSTNLFAQSTQSIVYPTFTVTSAIFPSDAGGFNLRQATFNGEPVAVIDYQTSDSSSFTERYFYIGESNKRYVPAHPSGYTTLKKYNCITTEGIKDRNFLTYNHYDENGVLIGGVLYVGRLCLWEYLP